MPLDPGKLQALVQRDNAVKPFHGEMPEEEEMSNEEGGGEEEGGEEEEFIDLTEREIEAIAEMVEDGDGVPELMDLGEEFVEAIETAMDENGIEEEEALEMVNPPAFVASPAIWEKAKKAVDPTGAGSKYTEPWAVTTHVYDRMGGAKK